MIKMRFRNIFILGVLFTCLLWLSSCQKTSQKPKNIIVMISDGCGYNQIEATSIYRYGGKNRQSFAAFPVKYGMSTYPAGGNYDPDSAWVDFDYARKRATDSAASATAIATGVKTNILALSVDTLGQQKHTILEKAELLGKSSGVVTSVPFAQATPAAFVAHNLSRFNYPEIAKDMINSQVDVIMGCGHPLYNNDGQTADSADYRNVGDEETWQLLVQGQMGNNADQDEQIEYWQLIQNIKGRDAAVN